MPFELVAIRGDAPGLSVLELEGIQDPGTVTPESPFRLEVGRPLGDDEHVLPVAFDGEFFLPLGHSERHGGTTRIILERLPDATAADSRPERAGTRSVQGSVRIAL